MFTSFKDFEIFTITKIYKGKDNYCRCGCGGKYGQWPPEGLWGGVWV